MNCQWSWCSLSNNWIASRIVFVSWIVINRRSTSAFNFFTRTFNNGILSRWIEFVFVWEFRFFYLKKSILSQEIHKYQFFLEKKKETKNILFHKRPNILSAVVYNHLECTWWFLFRLNYSDILQRCHDCNNVYIPTKYQWQNCTAGKLVQVSWRKKKAKSCKKNDTHK